MQRDEGRPTEQLLCDARRGNTPALEELLDCHRNYLTLLARLRVPRYLQSKVDDSDLVQETLCRAASDFHNFQGTTEPQWMQWLRSIMACVVTNQIRHYAGTQRRDVRLERQLERDLDQSTCAMEQVLTASDSTPSRKAARRETARQLADAIVDLPADLREVIILHYFEGLTMTTIAERMGRSASGTQKLWARAIVQLRRRLREIP